MRKKRHSSFEESETSSSQRDDEVSNDSVNESSSSALTDSGNQSTSTTSAEDSDLDSGKNKDSEEEPNSKNVNSKRSDSVGDSGSEEGSDLENGCSSTRDPFNNSTKNHSYDRKIPKGSASFKKKLPYVPKSLEGGKWYYKDACCPYCDKLMTRLDRHLVRVHADRETVQNIIALPKKSTLRCQLFQLLTNIGNEHYNKNEEINPNKKYIVKRRLACNVGKKLPHLKNKKQLESNEKTSVQKVDHKEVLNRKLNNKSKKNCSDKSKNSKRYKKNKKKKSKKRSFCRVICPVCRGYYSKNTYAKHFARIHGGLGMQSDTRMLLMAAKREMGNYHPEASDDTIMYVLPFLKDDKFGLLCKHDSLIINYSNKYTEQYDEDQCKLTRAHMRLMSKMLFEMKQIDPKITDLESSCHPHRFDSFMAAAKKICKMNKKTLGVPYYGHTIRTLWNRLFVILKGKYSRYACAEKRNEKKRMIDDYQDIFKDEYLAKIGSRAQRTENRNRRLKNSQEEIMDENDIKIYFEYLCKQRDKLLKKLLKSFNINVYISLVNCQMVLTMIFNVRRPGETDRCKLENYESRQRTNKNSDYFKVLNANDKHQAAKYDKMIVQGKKINGIDCAVYLTKKDVEAIDTMIKFRKDAGINPNNQYLYALPNHIRSQLMRHANAYEANLKLVKDCHENYKALKNPKLIRATKSRIQTATLFGATGDQSNLKNITNHLAHTENIHFQNYRKSVPQNDVNVTQFLETRLTEVSGGLINQSVDEFEDISDDNPDVEPTTQNSPEYEMIQREQEILSERNTSYPNKEIPTNSPIRSIENVEAKRNGKIYRRIIMDSESDDENQPPNSSTDAYSNEFSNLLNKTVVDFEQNTSNYETCMDNPQNIDLLKNYSNKYGKTVMVAVENLTQKKFNFKKLQDKPQKVNEPIMKKRKLDSTEVDESANKRKHVSKASSKGTRGYWTYEEKNAFNSAFRRQLAKGTKAKADEIRQAMKDYPCLEKKGEPALRTRFSNLYLRLRKQVYGGIK